MKKQGYDARLDESLGMREGKESEKKQSYKARRDESKGMEKAMGKRAYSGDRMMDRHSDHTLAHSLGHKHQHIAHAAGIKKS